jgi:hypothetical protein
MTLHNAAASAGKFAFRQVTGTAIVSTVSAGVFAAGHSRNIFKIQDLAKTPKGAAIAGALMGAVASLGMGGMIYDTTIAILPASNHSTGKFVNFII